MWTLACLAASVPAQDAPTTSGLRLGDVFVTGPGRGGFVVAAPRFDPAGPVLLIPDTSAWRLPPTPVPPTPAPTPDPAVLAMMPSVPRLVFGADADSGKMGRTALRPRGQTMQPPAPGHAVLTFKTGFNQVRSEFCLHAGSEISENREPWLKFLHGPGTIESFAVPEGTYVLERRLWRIDMPGVVIREFYSPQSLVSRGLYEFETGDNDEADILAGLRSRADRQRRAR